MKKNYEIPDLKVISFSVESVLTKSGETPIINAGGKETEIGGPINIFG